MVVVVALVVAGCEESISMADMVCQEGRANYIKKQKQSRNDYSCRRRAREGRKAKKDLLSVDDRFGSAANLICRGIFHVRLRSLGRGDFCGLVDL